METNLLPWLCENLELPLFRETEDGAIAANGRAQDLLSGRVPAHLGMCVQAAMGDTSDLDPLTRAAERARAGHPETVSGADGKRAIFMPAGPGRAAALVAPASFADLQALQQRAAFTDRSAGISHELANALGAIAGWARLGRAGERVSEALELIERSAESAWATARHFLIDAGGRGQHPQPVSPTDLSALCDEVSRLIGPKAERAQVRVTTDLAPNLMARADRGALWSVLWNLMGNGIEAMPEGGTLGVSLASEDGQLHLTVADSGHGMPEAVRTRIFEPYYTTKDQGAGIGLSVVRRTVEEFGGHIAVQSTEGAGTRFDVWVPLAQPQVPARRDVKRASGVFQTEHLDGRYLVVDDDEILREMVSTALQMRGATVVAVGSREEALALEGTFAVAVIDLLLSGTRGDELAASLRAKGVVDRVLLVTGTELPERVAEGGTPDAVLRKPFDLDVLYEALQGLVGRTMRSSQTG